MRISDWSSYVCSSDREVGLEGHLVRPVGRADRGRRRVDAVADSVDVQDEPLGVPGDRPPAQARDHRLPPATAIRGDANAWHMATENGRASWRERVCQYV